MKAGKLIAIIAGVSAVGFAAWYFMKPKAVVASTSDASTASAGTTPASTTPASTTPAGTTATVQSSSTPASTPASAPLATGLPFARVTAVQGKAVLLGVTGGAFAVNDNVVVSSPLYNGTFQIWYIATGSNAAGDYQNLYLDTPYTDTSVGTVAKA